MKDLAQLMSTPFSNDGCNSQEEIGVTSLYSSEQKYTGKIDDPGSSNLIDYLGEKAILHTYSLRNFMEVQSFNIFIRIAFC